MRRPGYTPSELPLWAVERIPWLRKRLLSWFKQSGRSFPWRDPERTPYEVVVAEILLQRTTAVGVARVYAGFVERYPSWDALAQAPLEGLENAIRPLGLSRRMGVSFPARARSWSACRGSAPTQRARSWPSCTGEQNRSLM